MARESAVPATSHYASHVMEKYSFAVSRMPKNGTILDVGMGTGFGIVNSGSPERFLGLDKNRFAIKLAEAENPELRGRVFHGDARNFSQHNLAGITAFEIIEHLGIKGKYDFIEAAPRAMKNGGVLVLSTPLSFGPVKTLNMHHIGKELTLEQLRELLEKRFRQTEYYGIGEMPQSFGKKIALRVLEAVASADILYLRRLLPGKSRSAAFDKLLGKQTIQPLAQYLEKQKLPRNIIAVCKKG